MSSEVVIVGGGMVGSALACALGQSSLFNSIKLIDTMKPPPMPDSSTPDPRVVTVSPQSHRFLESINAWGFIPESRKVDFSGMNVWDYYGTGELVFPESHGWVVENIAIQSANMQRVQELDCVEVIAPTKVEEVRRKEEQVEVLLEGGKVLSSSLVIGSDGRESKTRKDLGIKAWRKSYPHMGLVCNVKVHGGITEAYQRFLSTGPIALLPLWDDFVSVVWSLPPLEAERVKNLPNNDFLSEINSAISNQAETQFPSSQSIYPPFISELGSDRFTFPYMLQQAESYVDPRVALIGDAAHTIHPMAGQGFNLGVYDAMNLAKVLCEGARVGKDPGDISTLLEYSNKAKAYNLAIAGFEQGMLYAYTDFKPLHYARNLHYSLISYLSPVRKLFVGVASGDYFAPEDLPWEKNY